MAKLNTKAQEAYNEALRRIEKAGKDATVLDLSLLSLTSVPPEIGNLTKLTTLSLFNNQLMSVPSEIGHLTKLTELNLSFNQLTSVPREIGQLTKLTTLHLNYNQLTSVPPEIGLLTNLTTLYLSNNQLTRVPPEIGLLTKLSTMTLRNNGLLELPESLRQLSQLQALFLHDNPELDLPASVLGMPYDEWWKADQQLDSAPKPGPILDYYFRTRQPAERRPLREGKLILVGRGDVGKTSLVRRLIENKFDRREDTTQGIRILPWDVAVQPSESIRMHVWDFGGQEIMHATHQLFLTDRSLYLLVLDGRAGQQEAEADYWLRLIASFAPESPVLVVLNKIKKDRFDLNRLALREKFPQVRQFIETDCDNPGSNGEPGKLGHGIDHLTDAVSREVDQLPEIRQPFPASWFKIKEALSRAATNEAPTNKGWFGWLLGKEGRSQEQSKNYLTLDEYRDLCVRLGEPNAESQANLSLFLHRLGIALNFSDDPRLHDKHVLNPHWLTAGIYRLLNAPLLAERKGDLRAADLGTWLDPRQYPPEMHGFLLNLMKKFELCFSFDDQRFLVPELLDLQQPEAAEQFPASQCLNFHYRYPVVPPGLLPRFVVRTHVLSEQHRWRSGVILHFEENRALVKADAQDKTIRVLIDGPVASRRRMLAMIRQDFDVIHRDIPHLHPDELVSFPEHPAITEKYRDLEVLFADDPQTPVKRVVDGQVVTHTVRELLEGVEFAPLVSTHGPRGRGRGQPDWTGPNGEPAPLRVFYCYSRDDAKHRLKLAKYLSPLVRCGLIRGWHDNDLLPGVEWDPAILNELRQSDVILLLVSPNFTSSKYCFETELPIALERHRNGEATVVPVLLEETVRWKELPTGAVKLGALNALPSSGVPIRDWDGNGGWANVAAGVDRVAQELRQQRRGR